MYITEFSQAIATKELNAYLERQAEEIAPEPIRVRTPTRKARYHDKARVRLADIKVIALRDCKCSDAAEMKRRLRILGVSLDLRYTSSWIAIAWELQNHLVAILPLKPRILTSEEMLEKAVAEGAISDWKEDGEGDLFWIKLSPDSDPALVTSSGLTAYLRKLPLALQ